MDRRTICHLAASLAITAFAAAPITKALAQELPRLSGPYQHENLAVYFVHGTSVPGAVPLTLQEALAKGSASVLETGNVNELFVENTGSEELFIQAGDIVKGGRQDRVLTVSLIVPPKSGRVPIASFCVEQGRWSPRGREDAARFTSASEQIPSRAAKLALKEAASGSAAAPTAGVPAAGAPSEPVPSPSTAGPPNAMEQRSVDRRALAAGSPREGQAEIWAKVAETQRKLSEKLALPVASPQSATSLQLSLENERLQAARAAYVAALETKGSAGADIIGVVVAINGRLNSAEIYPSNGLFRKMWGKVLAAAATEALGEQSAPGGPPPTTAAVQEFIAAAEGGTPQERALPLRSKLETRRSDKALLSVLTSPGGVAYHRSLVARER